jgi:hypothetical protein
MQMVQPGDNKPTREAVDRTLRGLGTARAKHEFDLCRWLRVGREVEVHRACGYASLREYAERVLGLSARETEERLRIASALEALPEVSARFERGELHFAAVRELTRVATADTERAWLDATAEKTTREVERLVAGTERGDLPTDERRPDAERHRVTLDLSASSFALLRDARDELTRRTGHSIDDDAFVALLVRTALGQGEDAGRSPYRIAIAACPECGAAKRTGGAADVVIDRSALEMARCDAQVVAPNSRAAQNPAPSVRREVLDRHGRRCAVPGCRHSIHLDIHHTDLRSEGGTHDPNRLVPLCSAHHDALHRGVLVICGDATSGFTFEHADGRAYGSPAVSPRLVQTLATAKSIVRSLGFTTREAERMIECVRPGLEEHTSIEAAVSEALRAAPSPPHSMRVADAVESYRGAANVAPPRGGFAELPPLTGYDHSPIARSGITLPGSPRAPRARGTPSRSGPGRWRPASQQS